MNRRAVAIACLLVLGCRGQPPTPTPSQAPIAPATPVGSGPGEPSPSLGGLSCQLPVTLPGNAELPTHVADIRIANNDASDRIVFEFDDGVPRVELKQGQPPFTTDPGDQPLAVEGDAFLQLTMRGASRGGSDGPVTYEGPVDFAPSSIELWQVRMAGDFEGVMTFILGLVDPPCYSLFTLESPTRVVLDLAGQ